MYFVFDVNMISKKKKENNAYKDKIFTYYTLSRVRRQRYDKCHVVYAAIYNQRI